MRAHQVPTQGNQVVAAAAINEGFYVMKKIFLTVASVISILYSHAQSVATDTTNISKKLKLDEINLVSSYYQQNGDHAAVTGGKGSEKLSDVSNIIDVTLVKYDTKNRKNKYTLDIGIDHYTSASSDMIDLKANSSASHADTRFYPSVNWMREDEKRGNSLMGGLSYSKEFDYQSFGFNIGYAKKTGNKMGEFTAKAQAYFDQILLIAPTELRTSLDPEINGREHENYGKSNRNTFSLSLTYSQIINPNLQMELLADFVKQDGYLSLPFHRVYFQDQSVHQENLPNQRLKLPLGIRANYFLGNSFILRSYYRYYTDNWGVKSHTINLETPIKLSPFLSISPFYRYYTQTAANYFAPYQQHFMTDSYYTSNYDLTKFSSNFFGAGVRYNLVNGFFGIQRIDMLEVRFGHYSKSVGMTSNTISLNIRIK